MIICSKSLNGMLRHSFESLEGRNLLWHIVAPPPPSQPNFCLSFLLFCTQFGVACLFGWMIDSTRRSRRLARPTNKGKLNQRVLNILTSVWGLHTPNAGRNCHIQHFCAKKLKNAKSSKLGLKLNKK